MKDHTPVPQRQTARQPDLGGSGPERTSAPGGVSAPFHDLPRPAGADQGGSQDMDLHAEELLSTMCRMGKHIAQYDIAAGTLITLPQSAKLFGVPTVLEDFPESFLAHPPQGYPPESEEILRGFFAAIRRGEPTGACDYPTVSADGRRMWLRREFATLFDDQGRPVRSVISSEDITERYEASQKQVLERDSLYQIARLVFPEIVSCNLTRGTCEVIQSALEHPKSIPLDDFLTARLEYIDPEDHEAFRRQFFRDSQLQAIARGKERLQLTYRRRSPDGSWHWMETIALRHSGAHTDDVLSFIISRNVDQQKAQEERLRQALAESTDKLEGWQYYNRLTHNTYDGLTYVHYLDDRPSPYAVGSLAQRLDCPEKDLALGTCFRIPKEDQQAVLNALDRARQSGEATFHVDYRVETDRGQLVWIHNYAAEFTDRQGATGYIHFLSDTTQEHMLRQRLQQHMEERLKASERLFGIVSQHSNRILYQYDLASRTTIPWDETNAAKDALFHLHTGVYSEEALEHNSLVLPESVEDTKQFFADIHGGVPSGELNLHLRLQDGQIRWYHLQYTSMFDGDVPVTALISTEDMTERHEHELAYLRHAQSIADNTDKYLLYLEGCLMCDRVERMSGQLLSPEEAATRYTYSAFEAELLDRKFIFEERDEASHYFSIKNLLALYGRGQRHLEREWGVRFHDGSSRWLSIEVVLTPDPINDHVKAFIRVVDSTQEHEAQQSLHQRADHDAMTGLLRRGVGEALIREHLSAHRSPGGILMVMDLDDLKGINDTLGHLQGDKAIIGIAETLRSHFRKDDLLIRAGGDEFMVFLPGAGAGTDAVSLSVTTLLRKLSSITVGEHHERAIHCSIGCAVELPDTDTFDSLYQRADMALYHVKRSGKNNFAFYEPAMLEERYRFKVRQVQPVIQDTGRGRELEQLLAVVSTRYPGIVLFNLTRNYFRILTTGSNVSHVHPPDKVDVFWENWRTNIHPDDLPDTVSSMSRSHLLELYARGKRSLRCYYRNLEANGFIRTEVSVHLYGTDEGDVCAFLFFRWNSGRENTVEPSVPEAPKQIKE